MEEENYKYEDNDYETDPLFIKKAGLACMICFSDILILVSLFIHISGYLCFLILMITGIISFILGIYYSEKYKQGYYDLEDVFNKILLFSMVTLLILCIILVDKN